MQKAKLKGAAVGIVKLQVAGPAVSNYKSTAKLIIPVLRSKIGRVSVCERIRWMIQRTISSGRNKEYCEVNNEQDDYIVTGGGPHRNLFWCGGGL